MLSQAKADMLQVRWVLGRRQGQGTVRAHEPMAPWEIIHDEEHFSMALAYEPDTGSMALAVVASRALADGALKWPCVLGSIPSGSWTGSSSE